MNWDQVQGQWKNFRGQVRETWGKLTDQDMESIGGKKDRLSGIIQERYGLAKEKVESEINRFLDGLQPSEREKSATKDKI